MRVLHIVSNLSIRNGVMSVMMNYYKHIDSKDITFDFLYWDEKEENYNEEIKKMGGNIYKINITNNPLKIFHEINTFIKNNIQKYNVIHLHEVYLIMALVGLKRKNKNLKIISHSHATKFSENKLHSIRNKIMSIPNVFIPDYLFACSKKAGEATFGRKFKKIGKVLNNAIDISKFHPNFETRNKMRTEFKIEDKFVIGHVGNFNVQKNHDFLINVFYNIQKNKKNAVLVLTGDGEQRKKILEKCCELKIRDKVIYLGVRNDVNKVMNMFDCFVLPSIYEGLGIVLIEAQATGIPCVFSNTVPGEANIIKENNVQLSLKANKNEWLKAIMNSEGKKEIKPNERIQNAGYDINLEAQKLEDFYKNIK